MSTWLVTDEIFLEHDPGYGHPESPARLRAMLDDFSREPMAGVVVRSPRAATEAELHAVHGAAYVRALAGLSGQYGSLDPDTGVSPRSWEAAARAAGGAVEAVEAVWNGAAENAFVWARPPGHHAEPSRAMGFCLINNVAVAAEAARRLGAERVLILDWDVHHGNGTQRAFERRRDVLYASLHQFPFYPGTGAPQEIGLGEGEGYTVNCGLTPGQGDADYGAVFESVFLPVAQTFRPDFILVSAGFDPHARDPLGEMRLTERGFAAMTSALKSLARECGHERLVLLLEGGYDLAALAHSARACLEVLTGGHDTFPSGSGHARHAINDTKSALRGHWRLGGG